MIVLMAFVSGCLILGIVLIYLSKETKKDNSREKIFERKKKLLLSSLRRTEGLKDLKVNIIMKYNFSPYYLDKLISNCEEYGLVTSSESGVEMTDFGREYYDRFVRKDGKNKI